MDIILKSANKILLIAPHRLGDTLFATPGIRALHLAKPEAQIDAMALSSLSYESLKNNSCIQQVYRVDEQPIEKLAVNYDLVLPLQNIKKIQEYLQHVPHVLMLPRYTGAFHYSENFYRFILKNLPEASSFPMSHYELNFTEQDQSNADDLLKTIPKSQSFILAVHIGCHKIAKEGKNFFAKIFPFLTTKKSRSWSFKRFDQLLQRVLENHPQTHILLTGSANERFAADALKPHPRILNLMGRTNVTQLAALLQRCQLLLTGDTGPMHVACAVGLPMILLCGETDPAQTGPYPKNPHHTIIQKNGMNHISVDEVYDALKRYL